MPRTVTVGLDGSAESRAAAEWAVQEAALRGLPVQLVHVWEPVPQPTAGDVPSEARQRFLDEAAEALRPRLPSAGVTVVQRTGPVVDALVDAAGDAALLVLGSRALGAVKGFLLGSVGQAVIARTRTPVAVVRAGRAYGGSGPVVLGLDTDRPDDTLLGFAFEEARRRASALHVVQGRPVAPYYVYGLEAGAGAWPYDEFARQQTARLAEVVRPWRHKHPGVEVVETSRAGGAVDLLLEAARDASLLVVGRRVRRGPGAHIGSVAHAVLHHAAVPVAVVAHD
ncbi:universal stress protein [Streptomyces sp. CRN 30]|uniref:universal stress protein n=1 Tax=Streptomyces sp. CRN 30 TaxID=3075613 RepID=UPI002A8326ED|nr:universal stress protein [Streptomyces sp. CRN 30]